MLQGRLSTLKPPRGRSRALCAGSLAVPHIEIVKLGGVGAACFAGKLEIVRDSA
jgi:hypothetical protein